MVSVAVRVSPPIVTEKVTVSAPSATPSPLTVILRAPRIRSSLLRLTVVNRFPWLNV